MPCTVTWSGTSRVIVSNCSWVRVRLIMDLDASGTKRTGKYMITITPKSKCIPPNSTATLLERIGGNPGDSPVNMPTNPTGNVSNNWSVIGRGVSWTLRDSGSRRMFRYITIDSQGDDSTDIYEHELDVQIGGTATFDIRAISTNCTLDSVSC